MILEPSSKSLGTNPRRSIQYEVSPTGCWECISHTPNTQGYFRVRRNGVLLLMHRYLYAKYKGKIPKGYCVMHDCDNRTCINPNHLSVGTIAKNNEDMWVRGRGKLPFPSNTVPPPPRRGEDNNKAKLTEEDVKLIRSYPTTTTHKTIAKLFDVDRTTIGNIRARRTWNHVTK